MSVTDLTNTTWVFNDIITIDDSYSWDINFISNNTDFAFIKHSVSFSGFLTYLDAEQNPTGIYAGSTNKWTNEAYKTITITGGNNVTSSTLISWLQSNATQIVEQSFSPNRLYVKCNGNGRPQVKAVVAETEDALAGTWVLNDTIIYTNINPITSFNFTSNNTLFYGFYFDVNSDGDNSLGYRTNQNYSYNEIYDSSGHIISGKEAYKTITITSKLSEVTNGDTLLTWLQSNATKQSSAQTLTATNGGRLYTKVWIKEPLAAAQNLSIDGTTLTFDEVDGATSYDVYANETLIGEIEV